MKRGHTAVVKDHPILTKIRKSTERDSDVAKALETLQGGTPQKLKRGLEDWNTEDGLVLFRGKVHVPPDEELRKEVTRLHHNTLEAGHPGEQKTLELVTRNYWWPGITVFIKKYVETCNACQ
jgi:hypothetical protein